MSDWREIDFMRRLPERACCYVLYDQGGPAYVGSTINLKRRIARGTHHRCDPMNPANGVVKMKVKWTKKMGDWLMFEYRLQQRLRPHRNGLIPTRRLVNDSLHYGRDRNPQEWMR